VSDAGSRTAIHLPHRAGFALDRDWDLSLTLSKLNINV